MVRAPLDNDILHSFSPATKTHLQKNTANGNGGQRSERPHKYSTEPTQLLIMPNNTCFRKKKSIFQNRIYCVSRFSYAHNNDPLQSSFCITNLFKLSVEIKLYYKIIKQFTFISTLCIARFYLRGIPNTGGLTV